MQMRHLHPMQPLRKQMPTTEVSLWGANEAAAPPAQASSVALVGGGASDFVLLTF